jgi:hypothetical protein
MRDPERIDPLLEKVKEVWMKRPDLRLGQLISNAAELINLGNIFNVEDENLELGLKHLGRKFPSSQERLDRLISVMRDWSHDQTRTVKTRHIRDWIQALEKIEVAKD